MYLAFEAFWDSKEFRCSFKFLADSAIPVMLVVEGWSFLSRNLVDCRSPGITTGASGDTLAAGSPASLPELYGEKDKNINTRQNSILYIKDLGSIHKPFFGGDFGPRLS